MTQIDSGRGPVRKESFACTEPVEVDARLAAGLLTVDAVATDGITVEVSGDEPDGDSTGPTDLVARAVRETEVRFSAGDGKLVVRTPRHHALRSVRLAISAEVPVGSSLTSRAGNGTVRARGTITRLIAATGSGDIETGDVDGSVEIKAGSGDARLGRVGGRMRSRSGSGSFEAASIGDGATITTGSGSIRVGDVGADLAARTGSGSVIVENATAGRLDLATGSGDIRVGIHEGVVAEIDLVSGSGRARSELDVSPGPGVGTAAIRVRARTGSGDAVVARAGG
ncbi:MAG: DUF4097 family beta strand repeat-containing protein [Gaiellales bacterium]